MIHKKQSYGKAIYWLNGHQLTFKRYLREFYTRYDWDFIGGFFWENPIQARVILEDFKKPNWQKLSIVINIFIRGDSKIVFIVGARGSGKTATAFMFAEEVYNRTLRPIFYVSSYVDNKALPDWMIIVSSVSSVPKGSFAIIDESAIQFSARESFKEANILLGKELAIARHRNIFLIFITQHIAMSDINLDRLKDLVIWKRSNDYSFGVRGSKKTREGKFWDKVRNMMAPRSVDDCLFEYPSYRRFIYFKHELPECWSDELSRTWMDAQLNKKKEEIEEKNKDKKFIIKREIVEV